MYVIHLFIVRSNLPHKNVLHILCLRVDCIAKQNSCKFQLFHLKKIGLLGIHNKILYLQIDN